MIGLFIPNLELECRPSNVAVDNSGMTYEEFMSKYENISEPVEIDEEMEKLLVF